MLKDDALQDVIHSSSNAIAKEIGSTDEVMIKKIIDRQKKRAANILKAMRSTMSDLVIRFVEIIAIRCSSFASCIKPIFGYPLG